MKAGRSPYIVGPVYDWVFFLGPPVLALLAGIGIAGTRFDDRPFEVFGRPTTGAALLLGTVVHAHLVAVFLRSHGNPDVFRRYRYRFVLVPVLLFAAIRSAPVMAVTATVVATFWDVWHSGAQTFGLGRIYDRNAGNPPEMARRLDFWLNQLLYAGPILAGATMLDHFDAFADFEEVGARFLTPLPAFMERTHSLWTLAVVAAGTAFILFYAVWHWRMRHSGYRPSPHKVVLMASTGLCSIYCWGFDSWGEAFFIMNLLHAVQYLALVWAMEHRRLHERLRATWIGARKGVLLGGFLIAVLTYGAFAQLLDSSAETLWAVTIVVSLLHFWYDGFIWSVRRAEV
jgi:hypothetical protein